MAHQKSDTRLRRSPIHQTDEGKFAPSGGLPQNTSLHVPTTPAVDTRTPLPPPDARDPGYLAGTSNPGMKLGPYKDEASPPKGTGVPPRPGGLPFELKR